MDESGQSLAHIFFLYFLASQLAKSIQMPEVRGKGLGLEWEKFDIQYNYLSVCRKDMVYYFNIMTLFFLEI